MKKKKRNKPAYRTSVGSSTEVYLYVQTGIQEQILGMLGMKTMPENLDEIANLLQRKKELLYSSSRNSVAWNPSANTEGRGENRQYAAS